jgi:hypothetical protein
MNDLVRAKMIERRANEPRDEEDGDLVCEGPAFARAVPFYAEPAPSSALFSSTATKRRRTVNVDASWLRPRPRRER